MKPLDINLLRSSGVLQIWLDNSLRARLRRLCTRLAEMLLGAFR